LSAEPHLVLANGTDLSLLLKNRAFSRLDVPEFGAGISKPLTRELALEGRASFAFARALDPIAHAACVWTPLARWELRLDAEGGKAVENSALEEGYFTTGASVFWNFTPPLRLQAISSVYRAAERKEARVSLGFDYLF
jgi:hypothetical protein